jgi:hypothetical protein
VGNPENKVFDSPRADSSPQSERASALADVLGDVYRYVLTRPRRSESGPSQGEAKGGPEDAAHAEQRERETEQEKGPPGSGPDQIPYR